MSKKVKNLITNEFKKKFESVDDCVVVNVIGMGSNETTALRKALRSKDISLMVVKNSLARRATEGSSLYPAFEGMTGSAAIAYGAEDYVSLVKEIVEIQKQEADFPGFETRGGVMDGEALTPERVAEISKWPNRQEQLSLLVGQLLGPGSTLQNQLLGPAGQLASQIEKKSEGAE